MSTAEPDVATTIAVHRLIARGAHTADAGDGDGFAGLFAKDAVIDGLPRGPLVGREQIAAYYNERGLTDPPRRHHITSIDTYVDADGTLTARSNFFILGGDLVGGTYRHTFVQHDGEWLVKSKTTTFEFRRAW